MSDLWHDLIQIVWLFFKTLRLCMDIPMNYTHTVLAEEDRFKEDAISAVKLDGHITRQWVLQVSKCSQWWCPWHVASAIIRLDPSLVTRRNGMGVDPRNVLKNGKWLCNICSEISESHAHETLISADYPVISFQTLHEICRPIMICSLIFSTWSYDPCNSIFFRICVLFSGLKLHM